MTTSMIRAFSLFFALVLASTGIGAADLGNGFTYQGELLNNGAAADGVFDFQMELFGVSSGGAPIASAVIVENATVTNGVFAVELDFGINPFDGDQLWLEISVREGASVGGFTGLLPRQKLTATPFALHAQQVATASVGTQEIISSQVQRRVGGNCAVGSFVTSINENGTVVCAADTGLSSVTSADIVDGTIQTQDLANGSVSPAKLNTGASYTLGGLTVSGDLSVSGATGVGWQRVLVSFDLSSTAACHSHGNLTCWYGEGMVSCPVGKRLMGGGVSGSSARYGSASKSYPFSSTTWVCASSYDVSGQSRNCYALCARLE